MIKGLRGASIWSEDVKNLLPFYRDVLGLKVGSRPQASSCSVSWKRRRSR